MIGMIDNSCRTSWKWISFNNCHRLGDGDGLQGSATKKRHVANARHGLGDGDGLQGFATIKHIVANAGHGVGDDDGLQGFATIKRIITNAPCSLPNRIIL